MNSQKPLTVFLLSSLVAVVFGIMNASEYDCGTTEAEKELLFLAMETGCPNGIHEADKCCEAHDLCYDNQLGQNYCDITFRDCLQENVAPKYSFPFNMLCQRVPLFYYNGATELGADAYKEAGNNNLTQTLSDLSTSNDQEAGNSTNKHSKMAARPSLSENHSNILGFGTFEAVLALLWLAYGSL
ncbi:hypothetical protein L596_010804 [Steinernema carpocapsae]|uniref:Phospholipase A2 domain-containing protein n=1 Tax=Steinernema carpocapsae TaxID=34508 RepID=A0A4U5PLM9_STECR|nr:hypothetical protein L596_010804 [Steinernema carpocapsae]